MAVESKVIPTKTTVTTLANLIHIYTEYDALSELPNILAIIITNSVGTDGGVFFIENELLAQVKNYPADINISINNNGELIIVGNDAASYSINSNGELIYTIP